MRYRNAIRSFLWLVVLLFIFAIIIVITGIYFQELQASIYASKATIAQAQPQIVLAKSQLVISKSIAFENALNAVLLSVLAITPYLIAIIALCYIGIDYVNRKRKIEDEKIQ